MWRDNIAVTSNRPFRRLLLARSLALFGNSISPVALAFGLLASVRNGASLLGLALAVRGVAQVATVLFAGVFADRLRKQVLMAVSSFAAGSAQAVIAVMFVGHAVHPVIIAICSAVSGASAGMLFPAASSIVPQVVRADELRPANALLSFSQNLAMIVGSGVAGLLYVAIGPGWAIATDAICYGGAGVLLLMIRTNQQTKAQRSSMLLEIRQGWSAFIAQQWIWVIVLQFSLLNLCARGGYLVLGPLVAKDSLGGATSWSIVLAAQGVGLLAGSVIGMRIRPRLPMRLAVLVSFGAVPMFFLLAAPAPLWLFLPVSFGYGTCVDIFQVTWLTGLQTYVPAESLSRVLSYDALGSFALEPIGLAAAAPLAAHFGLGTTLVALGIVAFAVCAAALTSRSVRTLASLPAADAAGAAIAHTDDSVSGSDAADRGTTRAAGITP